MYGECCYFSIILLLLSYPLRFLSLRRRVIYLFFSLLLAALPKATGDTTSTVCVCSSVFRLRADRDHYSTAAAAAAVRPVTLSAAAAYSVVRIARARQHDGSTWLTAVYCFDYSSFLRPYFFFFFCLFRFRTLGARFWCARLCVRSRDPPARLRRPRSREKNSTRPQVRSNSCPYTGPDWSI